MSLRFRHLLERFARDERGVFAVIFGLLAIVLIAFGGAVVDYVSLDQARSRAQTALDAAALALQPDINNPAITREMLRQRAEAIVRERIGDPRSTVALVPASGVRADVLPVSVDTDAGRLTLTADFTLPTMFVGLVGVNQLGSRIVSEAVRGISDVEVAVALDVTGSMDGQDILDLQSAVRGLVTDIVQDDQSINTSRMALVPYSQAVNAGGYAVALRGPVRGPKGVSNITWLDSTSAKTITGITRSSNNPTVSASSHGYSNGDWVFIYGASGMTQINGQAFQVTGRTSGTFQLLDADTSRYNSYSNNGRVRRCVYAGCQLEITSLAHGYGVGDYLRLTDVGGITGVNNVTYRVASASTNTVRLEGFPTSGAGTYTLGTGQLHCTWQTATQGCTYYFFQNSDGNYATFPLTDCVTERAPPIDDRAPLTTFMGRNYPASSNGCLTSELVPLTANKTVLNNSINALSAAGSTSGSLGILYTWYALAPSFGYVWPASQPEPYLRRDLLKAAIIMTDGEFNTVHCNGVVANNSTSGSGATSDHNMCNAPNGDPYPQARAYCSAMKARGIVVYTVGFAITSGSTAAQFLTSCASTPSNYYLASNGSQLRAAFQQIARNISVLRLTR